MKPQFLKGTTMLVVVAVLLASAFTIAYGEGKEASQEMEKEVALTITEVLEKARENNLDLQKASLTLNNARINYEKAKASILQSQSKIDEKQAELTWQEAQHAFDESKNDMQAEIISLYSDLTYLTALVPLKEKKVELAQSNLDRVKETVRAGTAGDLEELAAEVSLMVSQQQLESTEQQLASAREGLSWAIGIDDLVQFSLVSRFEQDLIEGSVDTYMTTALQQRKELQFARGNIQIASDRLEELGMSGSAQLDLDKATNDLKLLQVNLGLMEESIRGEVRQRYQQLESLKTQLEILRLQLDQAQKNFENASRQFQVGLVTEDNLSSKKVSFEEASLELDKSKASYYIAYLKLEMGIGEKLEFGEGR